MPKDTRVGVCKLLRIDAPLVKSHIIPEAFTKRKFPKLPFMEMDGKKRPKRAWSSWYDGNLVCAQAESLFAKWDDYAAKVFNEQGLTFRSRRDRSLRPYDFIRVPRVDINQIRFFGFSLLWRAASSELEPFRSIVIDPDHLELLREMIITEHQGEPIDFPMMFLVHSESLENPPITPVFANMIETSFLRFYLDRVILYVGIRPQCLAALRFGQWLVGSHADLLLFSFPYDGSWQQRLTTKVAQTTLSEWGDPWRGL